MVERRAGQCAVAKSHALDFSVGKIGMIKKTMQNLAVIETHCPARRFMECLGSHVTTFDNGLVEHGTVKIGSRQIAVNNARIGQVSVAQVGTIEIATIKNGVPQVSMAAIDTAQVTVLPVHASQLAVVKLAAAHHAVVKAHPLQVPIDQRSATEVSSAGRCCTWSQAIKQCLFLCGLFFFLFKLPGDVDLWLHLVATDLFFRLSGFTTFQPRGLLAVGVQNGVRYALEVLLGRGFSWTFFSGHSGLSPGKLISL